MPEPADGIGVRESRLIDEVIRPCRSRARRTLEGLEPS